jgi:hypothetical protein
MSLKTKIELLESDIAKYDLEIKNTRSESKKDKIHRHRNNANYEIETLLMNFLEANNKDFQNLMNLNFDLLINDRIIFKVTAESGSIIPAYCSELEGKIHQNGYLYLTTKKASITILNAYPKSFSGLVNYFGETGIIANKKNYKFFGSRVPESFIGSIDYNGEIQLKTVKSFFDVQNICYIKKIIADPFSGDNTKRAEFLRNRKSMKKILEKTRSNHNYE